MNKRVAIGLTSTTLALGIAVGIGTVKNSALETKAASKVTMYLNLNQWAENWDLFNDGADSMYAYVFGGTTNVSWPGQKMIPTGVTGLYSLDVYSDDVNVNFLAVVDSSKEVKKRATNHNGVDITIPDLTVNNMFNLKHAFYDDGNYTGNWDAYEPEIADGAYLRGDWSNGWVTSGQKAMEGTGPYTIQNVALGAGGTFKMVVYEDGIKTWAEPSSVSPTTGDYPVSIANPESTKDITVTNAGLYDITVTHVNGNNYNYSLVGKDASSLSDAEYFAKGFTDAMKTNCPYTGDNKTTSDVVDTWKDQITAFNALSTSNPDAITFLTTSAGSTVKDITEFWDSYDWIYTHYQGVRDLEGANFLSRSLVPVANLNDNVTVFSQKTSDSSAWALAIIAGTATLASGAFFLLRRKNEE